MNFVDHADVSCVNNQSLGYTNCLPVLRSGDAHHCLN